VFMQERLTNFKNRIKKNNNVPKKVALVANEDEACLCRKGLQILKTA